MHVALQRRYKLAQADKDRKLELDYVNYIYWDSLLDGLCLPKALSILPWIIEDDLINPRLWLGRWFKDL